jgi:hypothetical protein
MYDAMHAVSHQAIPEIARGLSVEDDEGNAAPNGLFLRRAAVRISWLLVLLLRNTSASVTPLDLPNSGGRTAISRLVTEDECSTPEQNLKFVCRVSDFTSSNSKMGRAVSFRLGQTN